MVYAYMQHINKQWKLLFIFNLVSNYSRFRVHPKHKHRVYPPCGVYTFLWPGMYTTCTEAEIEVVKLGFGQFMDNFFYIIKVYANGRLLFWNEWTFKDSSNIFFSFRKHFARSGRVWHDLVLMIKYLEKNLWFIIKFILPIITLF